MCNACDTDEDGYRGDQLKLSKNIDGGRQNFEICLFDSPEDEGYVLEINGTHTDLRIDIKFCPLCGREL